MKITTSNNIKNREFYAQRTVKIRWKYFFRDFRRRFLRRPRQKWVQSTINFRSFLECATSHFCLRCKLEFGVTESLRNFAPGCEHISPNIPDSRETLTPRKKRETVTNVIDELPYVRKNCEALRKFSAPLRSQLHRSHTVSQCTELTKQFDAVNRATVANPEWLLRPKYWVCSSRVSQM